MTSAIKKIGSPIGNSADIIPLSSFRPRPTAVPTVVSKVYRITGPHRMEEILPNGMRRPLARSGQALTDLICSQVDCIISDHCGTVVLTDKSDPAAQKASAFFKGISSKPEHDSAFAKLISTISANPDGVMQNITYVWETGLFLSESHSSRDENGVEIETVNCIVISELEGNQWVGIFQSIACKPQKDAAGITSGPWGNPFQSRET